MSDAMTGTVSEQEYMRVLTEARALEAERDRLRMVHAGWTAQDGARYKALEAERDDLRGELAIHTVAAAMAQDMLNQQAHVLRQVAPDRGDLWQEYADVKAERDELERQVEAARAALEAIATAKAWEPIRTMASDGIAALAPQTGECGYVAHGDPARVCRKAKGHAGYCDAVTDAERQAREPKAGEVGS